MQLKPLALGALIAVSALHAQVATATTIDWGAHSNLEIAPVLTGIGSFSDTITFTLDDATNVSSTTVSNNLSPVLKLTGGKVSLYQDLTSEPDVLLGSYSFSGTTGDVTNTFFAPSAGSYYYLVEGSGEGSVGALYLLSSTTAPVPEPASWALSLAGLMSCVLVAYRRRKDQ